MFGEVGGLDEIGGEDAGDFPILFGNEGLDGEFSFDDELECDGLDAAGGEAGADFSRGGGDFVADEAVDDAAGLLGVDLVLVDQARVFEGVENGGLGDFVEDHAFGGLDVEVQGVGEVPGDGFAFAVQVGGEVDFGGVFGGGFEFGDQLFAGVEDGVGGGEGMLDVDVEALLGHVAHMAHGGFHGEAAAEVLVDGLGLGGGFDDDQGVAGASGGGGGGSFAGGLGHKCSFWYVVGQRLGGFPGYAGAANDAAGYCYATIVGGEPEGESAIEAVGL